MADRGKWAEAEVRKVLSDLERERAGFCFNRIPDARSGFMQPADADFQWFLDTRQEYVLKDRIVHNTLTRNGVIEVKEVDHLTLLPHKNFGSDKIGRVKRREMAGCEVVILIAHKLKGMRKPDVTWRSPPFDVFRDTVYVKGVGSWDVSQWPLVDMEAVVREIVK